MTVYTVPQIAERFSCNYRTVLKAIGSGNLPAQKIGKRYFVTEEAITAYLNGSASGKEQEIEKTLAARPELALLMNEAAKIPEDKAAAIIGELLTVLRNHATGN